MIEVAPKEYQKRMSWYDATIYCRFLIIDGKSNWRMPSMEELKQINIADVKFTYDCSIPIDDIHFAWSGKTYIHSNSIANSYAFLIDRGDVFGRLMKNSDFNFVLPVRDV